MSDGAIENYRFVVDRFPESDKAVPSYFSCSICYERRGQQCCHKITAVFHDKFRSHPLFASAMYVRQNSFFAKDDGRSYRAACAGAGRVCAVRAIPVSHRALLSPVEGRRQSLLILDYVRKKFLCRIAYRRGQYVIGIFT